MTLKTWLKSTKKQCGQNAKQKSPRVILGAAVMDMLHEGHLNLLRKMREAGDYVVMVLHDDRSVYEIKGKIPIQDFQHRMNNLMITGLVDEVLITMSRDPYVEFEEVINRFEDVTFMRADDNKQFPGRWIIDLYKIPILFIPYTDGVSSSKIRAEL